MLLNLPFRLAAVGYTLQWTLEAEINNCARGDTICPPLSSLSGRLSASHRRADRNITVRSHSQYVPTLTAAAAWRLTTAVSIKRPGDLDRWTFDPESGVRVTSVPIGVMALIDKISWSSGTGWRAKTFYNKIKYNHFIIITTTVFRFQRLFIARQRGYAVSFLNTMNTEREAICSRCLTLRLVFTTAALSWRA